MKQIISYFPFFTVIILTLGYAQMHYYYHSFGIPIEHYISLNEIVLNFFPSMIGWVFLFSVIGYSAYALLITRLDKLDNINSDSIFSEKILNIMAIVFFILYIIKIILHHYNSQFQLIASYLSMVFLQYLLIFTITINVVKKTPSILKQNYFKYFLIIAIWGPIFQGLNTYEKGTALYLQKFDSKITVAFTYQNTIYTHDSFMYIGETLDYVYLWDKKRKQAQIFPRKDIINYVIKEDFTL